MNLMDMIKDQVSGSLIQSATSFLGESESGVSKALEGIFPTLLGKLIGSSEQTDGMQKIFDMATGMDQGFLGNISDLFNGGAGNVAQLMNSGSGVLNLLFGNSTGSMIDTLSAFSGLKGSATSSLVKMAAPFLMSSIGKTVSEKGLDLTGLSSLIGSQKSVVANTIPSDLLSSLGSGFFGENLDFTSISNGGASDSLIEKAMDKAEDLFEDGKDSLENIADKIVDTGKDVVEGASESFEEISKSKPSLLKWIIPSLLALLLLGWLGSKGCNDASGSGTVTDTASEMVEDVTEKAGDIAESGLEWSSDALSGLFSTVDETAKSALDKITFSSKSAGEQMMNFISGGFKGDPLFRFNNLTFETGSSNITEESRSEVDNIAAVLNAYNAVNVKLNGYTDNTGDSDANVQLSQARAMSVKARLMALGVAGSRVSTEGYGSANPVASNDTEEGRQENKRVEIEIVK